ncbi:MAG TPA: 50S ribosomal protein L9 [Candidatus Paceibacterota bacterium]|nr:50S ribosomal protein L9 [Candidatus Paceibacterota bacterium]
MKVVLLDNVRGIGHVGDVRDVADGYARNFLLKRGLAHAATPGAIRDASVHASKKQEANALAHTEMAALADRLRGTTVNVAGHANEKGTLFDSIDAAKVAEAVSASAGIRISPDQVRLPEHIKTIGEHPIVLELADGITADVTVSVTR